MEDIKSVYHLRHKRHSVADPSREDYEAVFCVSYTVLVDRTRWISGIITVASRFRLT